MKNQLNEPLIRINWLRLKSYAGKGLNLVRKLGEEILKTILKILTAILLGFLAVYKRFSRFGRSKQRGIWILILITILLWMGVFVIQRERSHLNFLRETNQQYEELLNDYKELDSQIESLKDQPVDAENTDGHYLVENWRYLIEKYFPPEQVENAMAVMACESKGNPKAINKSDAKITGYYSCGLFQINGPTNWEWDNPDTNVDRAVTMFYTRGWQPWFRCGKKLGLL